MTDWPVKQTHHIPPYFALFYHREYRVKRIKKPFYQCRAVF